jgi:4-hydroxythreonine-4-phosphate dehydrogenase
VHALVTGPVTKWAASGAGGAFAGQTEYLARATGRRGVVMMFVSDHLRVVLLTRHMPLREVPGALTRRRLEAALRLTASALRRHFGARRPRIAVCGLNPHAGEHGLFGDEERTVLLPVLRRLRRAGFSCEGPFAADGFFARGVPYDAVACWYHDQGLIPFKLAARDAGCQLTIGLPMVRTSPDHGSALDIAGRGIAQPGSMRYAIALARRLARAGA